MPTATRLPGNWHRAVRALAGPHYLGATAIWTSALLGAATELATLLELAPSVWTLVIVVVADLAVWPGLLFGFRALQVRSVALRLVAMAAVGAASSGVLLAMWPLSDPPVGLSSWGLLYGATFALVWLTFFASVMDSAQRDVDASVALTSQEQVLAAVADDHFRALRDRRSQIARDIDIRLLDAVGAVRSECAAALTEEGRIPSRFTAQVSARLRHLRDNVVRPFSHQVREEGPGDPLPKREAVAMPTHVSFADLFRPLPRLVASSSRWPPRPWTVTALWLLYTVPSSIALYGWLEGIESSLVMTATVAILACLCALVFRRPLHLSGLPGRLAIQVAIVALLVAVPPLVLGVAFSLRTTIWVVLSDGLVMACLIVGSAAVASFRSRQQRTQRAISVLMDRTEFEMKNIDVQAELTNERIARTLHGPVAACLLAAEIRLTSSDDATQALAATVALLDDCVAAATQAVAVHEPPLPTLELKLAQLAQLWRGLNSLRWDVDEQLLDAIAADASLNRTLQLAISEAVTNAVRHAGADETTIALFQRDSRLILQVQNNGRLATPTEAGLGLSMIESSSLATSLSQGERGQVTLTVTYPAPVKRLDPNARDGPTLPRLELDFDGGRRR